MTLVRIDREVVNRRVHAVVLALTMAGCAPDPYGPLVCDPQRAGEAAFGYASGGGLGGSIEELLVIEGDCRFWTLHFDAVRRRNSEARAGRISPAELEALNGELLTGPWRSVDGLDVRREPFVTDGGSTDLWRDHIAACSGSCRDAPMIRELETAARRWLAVLYARGTPLDGPVAIAGVRAGIDDGGIEWTGTTPLAPAFLRLDDTGVAYGRLVVDDEGDAALLRAIRASTYPDGLSAIHDQGVRLDLSIRDVLPDSTRRPSAR